mmetsp:Transcript_62847/g.199073  ORF Transcript_62847/g.199073 Transcript_62847/m.199073 type:complete len:375 (-) Transcript_62847:915-2039(-)
MAVAAAGLCGRLTGGAARGSSTMVRVCCYRALSSSGPSPEEVAGMSMREAASKLAGSVVTSAGLVDACASRMESRRGLNAFVTESLESARKAAQASDARRAAGKALGPADGIPVAVKDNFCTLGERTSAGSRALESFISPYESTTTARLKASGAVVMGKTTMDEFGMGSFSMSGCTGPSLNPWGGEGGDGPFVAGGSSGGSAAAVAGGMAFAALGSDTGGSVRLPAAYTGCVGLKPSYGRLSRHGLIAYVSSTDCPGILARSVWDAAALLHLLQGEDAKDPTSLPPDPALGALVAGGADVWEEGVRGLRVGLPDECAVEELDPTVAAHWRLAAEWLTAAGAEVTRVRLPATRAALAAYYVIATAEASSNLARYD